MGEQYAGSTRIFSLQRMEELCQQGIDIESCDQDGKTFLRSACGDGKPDIVRFLLERGADPNSRDNEGKTPLMAAAITGRLEVVKLLVEHGADPTVETPKGDSAMKMAQRWGKKDIVQVLLERNAEASSPPDAGSQGVVRSASSERKEQAIHAPVVETGFKPSPQAPAEAVPSAARLVSPRDDEPVALSFVVSRVVEPEKQPISIPTGEMEVTVTVVDVTVTDTNLPTAQSGFTMPPLTTDEYIQALQKMKESPNDRIGILGSLGATGLGAAAGGGLAAILGASTTAVALTAPVMGSVTLGGWLGAAITATSVVAAPVTLVIGGAVAAAAIGYGVSKLIRSGARAGVIKEMNIKDLQDAIGLRKDVAGKTEVAEDKFKGLVESLQLLVKNNRMDQSDCTDLLAGVQNRAISYDYAFKTIEKLLQE